MIRPKKASGSVSRWLDGTLKAVYRHVLSDKAQEMNKLANEHFEVLLSVGSHKKKKP